MTKARTKGQKRREKPQKCPLSGVVLSAAPDASETVEARLRPVLARLCSMLGWPDNEANRKRVRNEPKMATLYGRLCMVSRLHLDAYEGIKEAERLERDYRRVMGYPHAGDGSGMGGEPDEDTIRRTAAEWQSLQGAFGYMRPVQRHAVRSIMGASPDTLPRDVTEAQAKLAEVAGFALARHFGLRT